MQDLAKKYCSGSKESWAVVTGATDGIGLGFCEVLTKLGFNVLLISRNPEKLKQTEEYLQTLRPAQFASSKLRSIAFNFKDCPDPAKWEVLMAELRQLDIALLVNNVGTSDMNQLEHFSHEFITDIISINCVAMAALTAEAARLMARRDRRSAIINLSSFLGEKAAPYVTLYSATKAFNREFSNSIAIECPFIDVMCLKPMFVESPLSKQKKGFGVPDRRECAWDSLKELGRESETYGYFSHRLMGFMARTFVPDWLYRFSVGRSAAKVFKKLYPDAKLQ
jgi:17beta-estradiol 17-dehydrogenase / very-long-chain 3-oxoacyl-CoA reductase